MSTAWTFHPVVETALRRAEWFPQRRIDITTWKHQLLLEGYDVFDYAIRVLSEFGGLVIAPIEDVRARFSSGPLRIHVVQDEYDRVAEWSTQLSVPLIPIGEWMDYYFVVVATDKRVFAGTLGQLLYLGATFDDALDRIVTATRQPEEVTA